MAKKRGFFSKVFGADSAMGKGGGALFDIYAQFAGNDRQRGQASRRQTDRLRTAQTRKFNQLMGRQQPSMAPVSHQGRKPRQGQAGYSRTGSGRLNIPGIGQVGTARDEQMNRRLRELEDEGL